MSLSKPSLDDLRIERRDEPESRFRFWPVVIVLAIVALLAGVFWWRNRPKGVEVRTVLARSADNKADRTVLNASGYVTARRAATVSSKVTGKVTEVLIEEGMKVEARQVLARLDDANARISLRLAEAQLDSARSALAETHVRIKEAEQELQRQTELMKNGIATQADFDHAEAAAAALKAKLRVQESDVTVAERQVASWQQQVDDTIIRAPFAGIVTSKNAQPGEMISPMSAGGFTRTGICTIVDMESLEIEIDVNESYINRVASGQPVTATLDSYADWKIPCKVIAIIPTADRQKSTVKVRVGFDQLDRRILPEMSVKVSFRDTETAESASSAGRSTFVPKTAVQQLDGRDVVLVVQNGRAERRAVTVSRVFNDETEIIAGVSAGERVVADWVNGVTDGTVIRETRDK